MFKNTEFYGGGKTSENSLNEPAELSLRCLAKTENDHCAAPCDTGVGDVGVPVEGIGYQMTLSSARALWGCALGGPAKGHPALHDRTRAPATHLCLGWAALGGGSPPGGYSSPGWQRRPIPYTVHCLPPLLQLWHKDNFSLISH